MKHELADEFVVVGFTSPRGGRPGSSRKMKSLRRKPIRPPCRIAAAWPVAVPLRWRELERVHNPDVYDLSGVMQRASCLRSDPFKGFASLRQRVLR